MATTQQIEDNPEFYFWTSNEYLEQLSNFVQDCKKVLQLGRDRYSADKINEDAEALYQSFMSNYTAMYNSYTLRLKQTMHDIKESYETPVNPNFSEGEGINELLRRQNSEASYRIMSDDKLKQFVNDDLDQIASLPVYDKKLILDELNNRGIDYDKAAFETAIENRYQLDPNYRQAATELKNVWASQPQGKSTQLAYFVNDDNGASVQFESVDLILNAAGLGSAAIDKLNVLNQGISLMKQLGSKHNDDLHESAVTDMNRYIDTQKATSQALQVADNDPRLNRNGSHWSWSVAYTFLAERFGSDPQIIGNPMYSDASNPSYDIEKRFNMLKKIYHGKKALGQYQPLKIVDTKGKDPEAMNEAEIDKVFGKATA